MVQSIAEQKITRLKAANGDLRRRFEDLQNGFGEQVEREIAKRFSDQPLHPSTDSSVLAKLKQQAHGLERQLISERDQHQDRLTAAIQEGWAMSSDEKVTAILEDRDRIAAQCLEIRHERDCLLAEQDKYEQYYAAQADRIKECEAEILGIQQAHDKVLAAQDATLAANNEHKRNLDKAHEQVASLVDQVFELEDELKAIKAARQETQRMTRPAPSQRDIRAIEETTGSVTRQGAKSGERQRKSQPVSRKVGHACIFS